MGSSYAGLMEFLVETFGDDNGSQERWEQVKDHYRSIEHWGAIHTRPLTQPYVYDADSIIKTHNFLVEANYSNGYRAAMRYQWANDSLYKAEVYIMPGVGDEEILNRPLIVGDAFDPLNKRGIEDLKNEPRYRNLLAAEGGDGYKTPRELGYDLVFVNFKQGGGRLERNSAILTRIIEEIHDQSNGPIVLAGISMSGILARMSQLYAMPENNKRKEYLFPQVIGWLSIDSPQMGAAISPLQRALWSMIRNEELARIMELGDIGNTLAVQYFQLNVPGAHQMLMTHFYPKVGYKSQVYDNFQAHLNQMGSFPDVFSVGIAYSNFKIPHPDIDPSQKHSLKELSISEAGYKYPLTVGGVNGSPFRAELEPGSTGNWYYQVFLDKQGSQMEELKSKERFTGTFVPIRSALALNVRDPFRYGQIENGSFVNGIHNRKVSEKSAFDEVYWMSEKNDYQREFFDEFSIVEPSQQDHRFEHMVFDKELMGLIEQSLNQIQLRTAWVPVMGIY